MIQQTDWLARDKRTLHFIACTGFRPEREELYDLSRLSLALIGQMNARDLPLPKILEHLDTERARNHKQIVFLPKVELLEAIKRDVTPQQLEDILREANESPVENEIEVISVAVALLLVHSKELKNKLLPSMSLRGIRSILAYRSVTNGPPRPCQLIFDRIHQLSQLLLPQNKAWPHEMSFIFQNYSKENFKLTTYLLKFINSEQICLPEIAYGIRTSLQKAHSLRYQLKATPEMLAEVQKDRDMMNFLARIRDDKDFVKKNRIGLNVHRLSYMIWRQFELCLQKRKTLKHRLLKTFTDPKVVEVCENTEANIRLEQQQAGLPFSRRVLGVMKQLIELVDQLKSAQTNKREANLQLSEGTLSHAILIDQEEDSHNMGAIKSHQETICDFVIELSPEVQRGHA